MSDEKPLQAWYCYDREEGEALAEHWPPDPKYFPLDETTRRYNADEVDARIAELEAELADWRDGADQLMVERCLVDEQHCGCVPVLERESAAKDARIAELEEGVRKLVECETLVEFVALAKALGAKITRVAPDVVLCSATRCGP